MNILLINVSLRPNSPLKLFPVGLSYIATAIKNAGFTFDLLDIDGHRPSDEQVDRFIRKKNYDVVCMGCIVTGYRIIKSLSSVIRRHHPSAKIVVGNSVASSIVDTLLNRTEADIAVIGEGDETIVDLLRAIQDSQPLDTVRGICFKTSSGLVKTPPRPMLDVSKLPFVDFSLFDVEVYIDNAKEQVSDPLPVPRESVRCLPINTARGCIAKCTFCYHVFRDHPYRYRPASAIIAEAKSMIEKYDLNFIRFSDELTFHSRRQSIELVDAIIDSGLKFYWVAVCRADLFSTEDDIEIIQKMKASGCMGATYSLESSSPEILKAMNKHISVEQFNRQTELFHKAGMPTWTSLVFGYPQETPETIAGTFDTCIANKIYPSAGYLLPQPGSPMYDYARDHGFIEDEEDYLMTVGDRQDLLLNFTQMSDEDLVSNVVNGLKRCNEELNIGLDESQLVKTQHYRSSQKAAA